MKLQNQVCSLEQGKRLAQLGISTNSHLSWFGDETLRLMDNGKDGVSYSNWVFVSQTEPVNNQEADWRDDVCITKPLAPAFSVAEMGLMIGRGTRAAEHFYNAVLDRLNSGNSFTIALAPQFVATCVIGLLERELLTPEEVNARLINS
jgi:hypothetical protein